jgi:hypothetical protein
MYVVPPDGRVAVQSTVAPPSTLEVAEEPEEAELAEEPETPEEPELPDEPELPEEGCVLDPDAREDVPDPPPEVLTDEDPELPEVDPVSSLPPVEELSDDEHADSARTLALKNRHWRALMTGILAVFGDKAAAPTRLKGERREARGAVARGETPLRRCHGTRCRRPFLAKPFGPRFSRMGRLGDDPGARG